MPVPPSLAPTYADLAELAEEAPLIVHVQIRKQATVEPKRAPGLAPGQARLYLEATAREALAGEMPAGALLRFLADVPLDARGKAPALKRRETLVFARSVPADPTQIQLVFANSELGWTPELDARVRAILAEMRAPDAPGRVVGVRDAMFVPGTLAGEGETQITLTTAKGPTAAISVTHQPGQPPHWTAAFGEVFDTSGGGPKPDSLGWYRLACFLPRDLPPQANLSASADDRRQAAADYRLVIDGLGPCARTAR